MVVRAAVRVVLLRRFLLGVLRALVAVAVVRAGARVQARGSISPAGSWMWVQVVFMPAILMRWRRRVLLRVVGLLRCVTVLMMW